MKTFIISWIAVLAFIGLFVFSRNYYLAWYIKAGGFISLLGVGYALSNWAEIVKSNNFLIGFKGTWIEKVISNLKPNKTSTKNDSTYSYSFKRNRNPFKKLIDKLNFPTLLIAGVSAVLLLTFFINKNLVDDNEAYQTDAVEIPEQNNNESTPIEESITPPQKTKPIASKTYALIVGIEQYAIGYDPRNTRVNSGYWIPNLSHCKDDCYRMKEFFKSKKGGSVPDENITMLLDDKALKQDILKSINKIAEQSGINDRIIIYFSGHGSGNELLTYEYDILKNNSLPIGLIDDELKQSWAKHKLLIADACIGPMPMGSKAKGAAEEFNNSLNEFEPSFLHLRSCSINELSYESSKYGQGFFSYWLLKGLNGEADSDNDLNVTISELFEFVKESVSHDVRIKASKIQTPQLKGETNPNMPMSTLK